MVGASEQETLIRRAARQNPAEEKWKGKTQHRALVHDAGTEARGGGVGGKGHLQRQAWAGARGQPGSPSFLRISPTGLSSRATASDSRRINPITTSSSGLPLHGMPRPEPRLSGPDTPSPPESPWTCVRRSRGLGLGPSPVASRAPEATGSVIQSPVFPARASLSR